MLRSTLLIIFAAIARVQASPLATISSGAVNGQQCSSTAANAFLGIPFAQPPTGNLRFLSPVPVQGPFSGGSFNATKIAPLCPQTGPAALITAGPESEDCLYLNVWTPANATSNSSLPVKVFIYGGAYADGGTLVPMYDGCSLATDALIVTIAYRLGPLGFLALAGAGIKGNMGVEDALLGLQWVQNNIAPFGGSPVGHAPVSIACLTFPTEKRRPLRRIGWRRHDVHSVDPPASSVLDGRGGE